MEIELKNKPLIEDKRLEALRILNALKKKYTYAEISEVSGISQRSLFNWYNGKTAMTLYSCERIINLIKK